MDNIKDIEDVSIEQCGLINLNMEDPIFKFCKLNNIKTVGEFIKTYKSKRANNEMSKQNNFEYFDGIVELLRLFFFGVSLGANDVFFKKFEILQDPHTKLYYATLFRTNYYNSLKRLGFTNNETKTLIAYVTHLNYSISVINAIKSYLADNCGIKIRSKKAQEIFIKKLLIFESYYDNNIDLLMDIANNSFPEIERLFLKRREIMNQLAKLEDDLLSINIEIDSKLDKLPKKEKLTLKKKYCYKHNVAK